MKKNEKKGVLEALDWVETFVLALGFVIFMFTFIIKFVTVSGTSMNMTLGDRDKLITTHIAYTPEAGDIVVIDVRDNLDNHPEFPISKKEPFIKRVIATEGQTVDIDPNTWRVYVDGKAIDEPYVYDNGVSDYMATGTVKYPYTVSEGCVFVMGDNRNGSTDSRWIDEVKNEYILGKVILRLAPKFGKVD